MDTLAKLVLSSLLLASITSAFPEEHVKDDLITEALASDLSWDSNIIHDDAAGHRIADKGQLFDVDQFRSVANSEKNGTKCLGPNREACYCSLFSDNRMAGGTGGASGQWFGEGAGQFPIQSIGVWAGESYIYCIQIWFFGGWRFDFGAQGGSFKKITFGAAERITSMSVWGNGAGRVGGIKIVTSGGQDWAFGMKGQWIASEEVKFNCGSGIIMNVFGKWTQSSNILYGFGFDFLQGYNSRAVTIGSMQYYQLDQAPIEGVRKKIKEAQYNNDHDYKQKQVFAGSFTFSSYSQWHIYSYMRFSSSYRVSASPPVVSGQGDSVKWGMGQQEHFLSEGGNLESVYHYKADLELEPHTTMSVEAFSFVDSIKVYFDCAMVFPLNNGAHYSLSTWGVFRGRSFRQIMVHWEWHTQHSGSGVIVTKHDDDEDDSPDGEDELILERPLALGS